MTLFCLFRVSVNLKNTEGESKSDVLVAHGKIDYLTAKTSLTYGNNNYNGDFAVSMPQDFDPFCQTTSIYLT